MDHWPDMVLHSVVLTGASPKIFVLLIYKIPSNYQQYNMQEHQLCNNCTEDNYFPHFHNKPLHAGSAHLLCCLHLDEEPRTTILKLRLLKQE